MRKLEVIYKSPSEIYPYKHNAKLHPREQIEQIKNSIKEFGFNDPIAIDEEGVIIEGHGRHIASQELGLEEIPVIVLEGLTDQQKKAYILAHNKLTMNTGFDIDILGDELEKITDFDMGDFGFDIESIEDDWEEKHEEYKEAERDADANILKLERAQYVGVGKYDIPALEPVTNLPEIREWIPFNYVLSDKNPEGKGVHFFINDYQFERVWNNPDAYIDKLSRYVAVTTPDFSPYGDMPFCLQLFNHYRKHWVGRYLQEAGITVIPTIRCSTDPRSLDFYLDGEPEGGAVIISSMWTNSDEEKEIFRNEYETMFERLNPNKVFIYGKEMDGLPGNIIRIPTFSENRWR